MKVKSTKKRSKKSSMSDLSRIDSMSDKNIDTSDIPPLDNGFWDKAVLRTPVAKSSVTIRIDKDILEWLKGQGKGYQTRINAILRAYMEAHLR